MSRWRGAQGEEYAGRFDAAAARGEDVHGEADLCEWLVPAPARVLDAGCGTGRVAIRLAARGYDATGVDLDASMLAAARRRGPGVRFVQADLSELDLAETFDLVVMAGNVLPLVEPGTEPEVMSRLASHLRPDAPLVAGFGLDRAHLPPEAGLIGLAAYDDWCRRAGLAPEVRWSTWDRQPYDEGAGYAVSVHRRRAAPAPPPAASARPPVR